MGLPTDPVKAQITHHQALVDDALSVGQSGSNASNHFFNIKGLGDVITSAQFKPQQAVVQIPFCTQYECRCCLRPLSHAPKQLQPIQPREHQV